MKLMRVAQFTLVLLFFTALSSCEEETFTAILQEGTAPSSDESEIDVATDNSGMVTVTPNAEGAYKYEVFFGEMANETPTTVGIESETTYTYRAEGDYTIRIVAFSPSEKTTETTFDITVELTAIINLVSGSSASEDNPSLITFTPSAENAVRFEILFGDEENEVPTIIEAGESVVRQYPAGGEFTATITGIGANGKTAEITQLFSFEPVFCTQIFGAPVTLDNGESFFAFNGATVQVIPNPDLSGANTSASNVLEIVQDGGGDFDGFGTGLAVPANFSASDKVVRVKVWSQTAITVGLNMQQSPNNNTEREATVSATHSGSGWEELEFDFANAVAGFTGNADGALGIPDFTPFVPTGEYSQFVMFIAPGEDVAGTFYLDDIGVCPAGSMPPPEPVTCAPIFGAPVTLDNGESFFAFNGATVQVVANPDQSGANPTASNVLEIIQDGGGDFDGFGTALSAPANFSSDDKVVRVKVWSQVALSVGLNMQQSPNNDTEREATVSATHSGSGWEELEFDFANAVAGFTGNADGALGIPDFTPFVPTGAYSQFVMFIAPGEDVAGTFYLDDVGVCP